MKKIFNFLSRIPMFLAATPVILIIVAFTWFIIALAMVIGVFYIMFEFLIYGGSKVDKEVKFENSEEKTNEENDLDGDIDDFDDLDDIGDDELPNDIDK